MLFQARFDNLWERFETFSSGETLFGMEITDYPALHQRKRELNLLQKLYSLYLVVNRTIDGYFEIPWSEVDIDVIIAELADFQAKYKIHWPLYTFEFKWNIYKNFLCANLDVDDYQKG